MSVHIAVVLSMLVAASFVSSTECHAAPAKKPATARAHRKTAPSQVPLPGAMLGGMPIPASTSPVPLPHVGGGMIGPDEGVFHQWSYDFECSSPMSFQVPMSDFEQCLDKLYATAHPGKTLGQRDEGAMAKIGFYLMRDGRVTGARILDSSKNPAFKAEALDMVRRVRLPKGWQKGPALVVCELTIFGGESNPSMDPEPEDGAIP